MEITAKMVMNLREKTGVGMMDCKKALQESDGDMDKAVDWLRKKGISKAAKRADRATSAGVIGTFVGDDQKLITLVELNCETDFVAKNPDFGALADQLAEHVAKTGTTDADALGGEKFTFDASKTINDLMAEAVAKIGEALKIGRVLLWRAEADDSVLGYYLHTGASAVGLVEMTGAASKDVSELGKNLGMQIVAARPAYLAPADVPADVIEKEKEIYKAEAAAAGKPEKILDKIAEGKLNKFYQDNCLIKQAYVKDPKGKTSVEQLLKEHSVSLARYERITVGA
ncbi:MAG: translation elongation factor Ts [Alphaproteobacteria bacterium]